MDKIELTNKLNDLICAKRKTRQTQLIEEISLAFDTQSSKIKELEEKIVLYELPTEFEIDKICIQFKCEFAIYPKGRDNSLCYTTDKNRAQWIVTRLNKVKQLEKEIKILRKALHHEAPEKYPVKCEICQGKNLGIRENENTV